MSLKKNDVLLATAAGIATGLLVYAFRIAKREYKTRRILSEIADEGYETASELFPGNDKLGKKLHYGPVLPSN